MIVFYMAPTQNQDWSRRAADTPRPALRSEVTLSLLLLLLATLSLATPLALTNWVLVGYNFTCFVLLKPSIRIKNDHFFIWSQQGTS